MSAAPNNNLFSLSRHDSTHIRLRLRELTSPPVSSTTPNSAQLVRRPSAADMAAVDNWPKIRNDVTYSDDSNLNTLQTCIPRPTSSNDRSRIWVVYIHGGAWRDPDESASSFDKAQELLLNSPVAERIAGLASINYRLSPYPTHATNPSNPADPARNARHPDHINDVLAAILHLQETYRFEERYVLVGHSAGACLALQVAMKRYWRSQYESVHGLELNVVPPVAILGIEGIYDLPAMVAHHDKQREHVYRDFTESAFGPNFSEWEAASPTRSDLNATWQDGKLVVIAHSHDDELIEWEQPDLMIKSLATQGFSDAGSRRLKLLELHGKHNQVWSEGTELARAIEWTTHELYSTP